MPVSEEFLDYILDQLEGLGPVHHKRMFGGVGLYAGEVFFGLLAGDVLYMKVDDVNRARYLAAGARPFQPYGEGGYSMSYYEVPAKVLEDREKLADWARASVDAALRKPAGKKGASRKQAGKKGAGRR